MLFLGKAANYRFRDTLAHTFAWGMNYHSMRLKQHLAGRYDATPSNVALYQSGRSAICAGLKSLLPKGGEVIINGLTCYAVVEAVQSAGCTPVFADIIAKNLHYSAKSLSDTLKKHPKAKAIIIQNTLGLPCDITKIEKVAQKHNLLIIEDLAHCTGVKYSDGREVGTIGDATMLSFGKGKSIDTITGGALILRSKAAKMPVQPTHKPKLSDRLRTRWYPFFGLCMRGLAHIHLDKPFTGMLRLFHWIEPSADTGLKLNTRLTHWQAKRALKQLKQIPPEGRGPIRGFQLVKNRDELLAELRKKGFRFEEIWYTPPVSPERYYQKVNYPEKDCPNSVRISSEIINLPLHYPVNKLTPATKIIDRYVK